MYDNYFSEPSVIEHDDPRYTGGKSILNGTSYENENVIFKNLLHDF
jgi:hypothetical protein